MAQNNNKSNMKLNLFLIFVLLNESNEKLLYDRLRVIESEKKRKVVSDEHEAYNTIEPNMIVIVIVQFKPDRDVRNVMYYNWNETS